VAGLLLWYVVARPPASVVPGRVEVEARPTVRVSPRGGGRRVCSSAQGVGEGRNGTRARFWPLKSVLPGP